MIDKDDNDDYWADPRELLGGRSRPSDGNYNDNGEDEEDTQGGENGTRKLQGTKDGKGKGKGKGKGNCQEKGCV